MGVIASFQLRRADRRMAKTLVFVKCAFVGDVARLQELMARDKMSPNAQDRFGMTALHWAAYGGKLACVEALLQAGASMSITDANGRNALHHACRKDHEEVVRYLVSEAKMDVNSLSESSDTPLHKAVVGKSLRCIEVLLQCGANPNLKNDQNRTPLDELDTDPSIVKDVLPEPIPTARMQEELDNWRREFSTEVQTSGRRRSSLEMLLTPKTNHAPEPSRSQPSLNDKSAKKYSANANVSANSNRSVQEVENTLVTAFRARISEFSERSSSAGDLSTGSRPSSAHFVTKSLWAKPSAFNQNGSGESSASDSNASTGRRESRSGRAVVLPLNLQGLEPPSTTSTMVGTTAPASDTTQASQSSTTHGVDPTTSRKSLNLRARNLRYAGKRVIMVLRVKKCLTGNEKVEVIRLLLERHMKSAFDGGPDTVHPIGNPPTVREEGEQASSHGAHELTRATSGVRLSMPPNF